MRFLMMHRLDERAPEAWNPSQEFIEKMGAFIQDSIDKGILITGEGVHPSEKGALVRKARGAAITATDGPFIEWIKHIPALYLDTGSQDPAKI